jgi:transcriptional regulator with XRE-family HTH domain
MRDRSSLISKLRDSRKARESYIRSKLNVLLPSQLRGLRLRREMKQEELGHEAEMKQSRISAMERPGEVSFNVETLIRLAAALRVGLRVEFVPFSEMLTWENGFSQDRFNPTPIENDADFIQPEAAQSVTDSVSDSVAVALSGSPQPRQEAADLRPPKMPASQFRDPLLTEGWYEASGGNARQSAGVC